MQAKKIQQGVLYATRQNKWGSLHATYVVPVPVYFRTSDWDKSGVKNGYRPASKWPHLKGTSQPMLMATAPASIEKTLQKWVEAGADPDSAPAELLDVVIVADQVAALLDNDNGIVPSEHPLPGQWCWTTELPRTVIGPYVDVMAVEVAKEAAIKARWDKESTHRDLNKQRVATALTQMAALNRSGDILPEWSTMRGENPSVSIHLSDLEAILAEALRED